MSVLAEPTKIATLSESEERKRLGYPRPAIRKGLIKITRIDDLDFSNPIVIDKLAAIHEFILSLPNHTFQGEEHADKHHVGS